MSGYHFLALAVCALIFLWALMARRVLWWLTSLGACITVIWIGYNAGWEALIFIPLGAMLLAGLVGIIDAASNGGII